MDQEEQDESDWQKIVVNDKFSVRKSFNLIILHMINEDSKIMFYNDVNSLNLIVNFEIICDK